MNVIVTMISSVISFLTITFQSIFDPEEWKAAYSVFKGAVFFIFITMLIKPLLLIALAVIVFGIGIVIS